MQRPSKFKYGPYNFEIYYRDDLVEKVGSMGETYFNHLEVAIDSRMKPQMEKETMFHELLHVVLHDIGFFPDQDTEEKFIRLLSPRLVQLLTDNQELTQYIFNSEVTHGKHRKSRKN